MASLNTYLRQTQRFLRDANQELLNPLDLIDYINQARREIALRAECIRILPPTSGALVSASVTAGGQGYTAPVVTVSLPDSPSGAGTYPSGNQATASAITAMGSITSILITYGGYGYFQPSIAITDPTGSGAAAVPVMQTLASTVPGQEVYPFSAFPISSFPGIASIHQVKSLSVIFSQFRYTLRYKSFSEYQALIRQYSSGFYQYVPSTFSQFGQGASGSLYVYPIPNQPYQLEADCLCLPLNLAVDADYEVLPDPWTDLVPYYAAHLAYLELQNFNFAKGYLDMFGEKMARFGCGVRGGRAPNMYGRG